MSINVMNEYTKITIKQLNEYMKLILEYKYNKEICDEFTDVYINIRYNGLIEGKRGLTVRNKLLAELKNKKDLLLENMPDRSQNIEYTYLFFDDCAYFDTAEINEDLSDEINNIINTRKEYLQKDETEEETREFEIKLKTVIKDNIKEKDDFINKFDTNEFIANTINYKENLQKIRLGYNIKFPMIYSMEAIEKAYSTGLVKEDKLFIEYYLTAIKVIRNIENSEYRNEYIVDFDNELFEKDQKLQRLFEIINYPTLQDRIIIQIDYEMIDKNKAKIYEMVSNGFKIAIVIPDNFLADEADIQRLALFKYIISYKENDLLKGLDNLLIVR